MGVGPSVLYIDGDIERADSVVTYLQHRKPPLLVTTVQSTQRALERVENRTYDCIVSCQDLADGTGLELFDAVRDELPETPFVLATAGGDEQLASEAFSLGIDDYYIHGAEPLSSLADSVDTLVAETAVESPEFDARVLEDLLAHIPDTVYVKDGGGRFLKVSESKAHEVQTTRHELIGESDFDHFPRDVAEEMYEDEQRIIETSDPVINKVERIERPDDEDRWVLATKIPRYRDGEPVGTMGISRDITDRQHYLDTINDLLDATERLVVADSTEQVRHSVLETAREMLDFRAAAHAVADTESVEITAQRGPTEDALEAEGQTPALESAVQDAIYTSEPVFREGTTGADATTLADGTTVSAAMALPVDDHGVFWFGCVESNAFGQHRKDAARILVSNARAALGRVERRNRLEQKRRETERLEHFGEEVAHDLRSPLSVAAGAVDLARQDGDVEHLDRAAEALDRVGTIIDETLDLARAGRHADEREVVDLTAVVGDAWEGVETDAAALQPPSASVELAADRARLVTVFENLFRNAVEHGFRAPDSQVGQDADSSGRVTGEDGDPAVTVDVSWVGDGVVVSDDGPGVDESVGEDIFERGVTTRDTGSGYGLAIVEGVVTAHGWDIDVDTDADGARFEITGVDAERR